MLIKSFYLYIKTSIPTWIIAYIPYHFIALRHPFDAMFNFGPDGRFIGLIILSVGALVGLVLAVSTFILGFTKNNIIITLGCSLMGGLTGSLQGVLLCWPKDFGFSYTVNVREPLISVGIAFAFGFVLTFPIILIAAKKRQRQGLRGDFNR
jgi:hypothetical protein